MKNLLNQLIVNNICIYLQRAYCREEGKTKSIILYAYLSHHSADLFICGIVDLLSFVSQVTHLVLGHAFVEGARLRQLLARLRKPITHLPISSQAVHRSSKDFVAGLS